jgi:hypothetical protein
MFKLWTSSLLAVSVGLATPLSAIAQDSIDYKEQEKLHKIADAMQADRIESDIQTLVDFGTRHTLSETESDTRGLVLRGAGFLPNLSAYPKPAVVVLK